MHDDRCLLQVQAFAEEIGGEQQIDALGGAHRTGGSSTRRELRQHGFARHTPACDARAVRRECRDARIAGIVVAFTGAPFADSIVSILIGVLILGSSWGILQESVNVLLESIPKGMDMDLVEQTIAGVPGVLAVHDLHVWTIGSGIIACSCHITVGEQSISSGQNVLRGVNEELARHFGISHSTIQVEVEGCDPDDMYCIVRAIGHGRMLQHRH